MIEHSMYDVTTGLNVDFVFYSLDLPKCYYPSTILEPEYGPWAFCLFCIITAMYGVHSIFFFCSLSLGCHFVIIFIDFCVFFPGKMVRGRSYRCCTGGSHWCCILCIAQGHRFVNQSLRTILVNWWEFMAWGLLVWNRYSLKI